MTTFRPIGGLVGGGGQMGGPGGGVITPLRLVAAPPTLPTIIDVEASRRDSGVLIEEDSPYDSSNGSSGSNGGGVQGWAAKVAETGGRARLAAAAMGAIGAGILPHATAPVKPYDSKV